MDLQRAEGQDFHLINYMHHSYCGDVMITTVRTKPEGAQCEKLSTFHKDLDK